MSIFLALAASLTSTACGAAVAYVIAPVVNRINDYALGVFQLPDLPDENPLENLSGTVDTLGKELSGLSRLVQEYLLPTFEFMPSFMKAVKDFREELGGVQQSLTEITTNLSTAATAVAKIPEKVREGSESTRRDIRSLAEQSASGISKEFSKVTKAIGEIPSEVREGLKSAQKDINGLLAHFKKLTTRAEEAFATLGETMPKIESTLKPLASLPKKAQETVRDLSDVRREVGELIASARRVLERFETLCQSTRQMADANRATCDSMQAVQEDERRLLDYLESLATVLAQWQRLFARLEESHGEEMQDLNSKIGEMNSRIEGLHKWLDDRDQQIDWMQAHIDGLQNGGPGLIQRFKQWCFNGKKRRPADPELGKQRSEDVVPVPPGSPAKQTDLDGE